MRDNPRIRGEHPSHVSTLMSPKGSSPHTRGARGHSTRAACSRLDHPRIRGEHAEADGARLEAEGSSPHTRGALLDDPQRPWNPGIIPAYAGSTSTVPIALMATADHPRIRGEH